MGKTLVGMSACIFLVLLAIAAHDPNKNGKAMSQITLEKLPLEGAGSAHRVVYCGASSRMFLGAMAEGKVALDLFEVKERSVLPFTSIDLLLPAKMDFDLLATGSEQGIIVAYEAHGGAISQVRVQPIVAQERLQLPARKALVDERRPRFVRGGGTAVVISENDEHAVDLEVGTTPRRMELCTCLDAIALKTAIGLAVVEKTLRPGAQVADVPPGALTLHWPWISDADTARPLFDGRDVYDYDAITYTDGIVIAAVTIKGLEVEMVDHDRTEWSILANGLPEGHDLFSPALNASDSALRIATLARPTLQPEEPASLYFGSYHR